MFVVYVDTTPSHRFETEQEAELYISQWRGFYGNRITFIEEN